MSNLNLYGKDVKGIFISYFFEPLNIVTNCTLWVPQLHIKYNQLQVSSI